MFAEFISTFQSGILPRAVGIIFRLWPVWAPTILLVEGFRLWMEYKQREWIKAQGSILLEIRLPGDIVKSPALMEVVLQTLSQTGVGSLTDVYLKGRTRPWFSLELVSTGGEVHFYIWMQAKWKGLVETAFYAQFPSVEIYEVPDYALAIPYDTVKYKYGKFAHMVFTKPDAYPIKTYVDYGLDKDPKEEYKNDPLSAVLEFLGSLKPGEHAWIQILLQGHTKEGFKYVRFTTKSDWKAAANDEIKKIVQKEAKLKGEDEKAVDPKFLSEGQKDAIKAIERTLEKTAFDSMIRVGYFAEAEAFNGNNIGGILGVLKQFGSQALNGFRPSSYDYDYPWQDIDFGSFGNFLNKKLRTDQEFFEAYKRREIFSGKYKNYHDDKPYILTTEEVATLFHFPSAIVAATPSLARIPSKKADAPANLPV